MVEKERELHVFRKLNETRDGLEEELFLAGLELERARALRRHHTHASEGAGLHILIALILGVGAVTTGAWSGLGLSLLWLAVGVGSGLGRDDERRAVALSEARARRRLARQLGRRLRASPRRTVTLEGQLSVPTEGVTFISRDLSDTGIRVCLNTDEAPTWLSPGARTRVAFRGPAGPGAARDAEVVWFAPHLEDGVEVGLRFAEPAASVAVSRQDGDAFGTARASFFAPEEIEMQLN